MNSMRPKPQISLNLKILLCGFFLAILLFILRSNMQPSKKTSFLRNNIHSDEENSTPATCTKLPSSLSQALIHYSTSKITPQQTFSEISVSAKVLLQKSPCNFLVFGLGYDSLMWASLNHGGRTVFLEEDKSWIEQIQKKFPSLESYHVKYDSKITESENLMKIGNEEKCKVVSDPRYTKCDLALKGLPVDIYETEWDLIMVDAPTGYHKEAPGRMKAIYTAGLFARNREDGETNVFVHDINRSVEDKFSMAFLCDGYMTEEEGRIRHFTIPSHRTSLNDKPFCPAS